ncbi:AAA family ATPase [Nonomuraea rhizosphaerae]|uniref:AAA family ATPase n=1 Tax=Nonomuraea rhizosphaerae TaxID=2665663 RepID=UPI001C5E8545|nr:ATP-binding protein [Nonomuraea rhizosphaerae]
MSARLTELRLTEFKTFRDAVLPLGATTVLIGRNSSGKSNALDALDALSRLAEGGDIVDALDSRRTDEGPLRGGISGCPPHGSDQFRLGCSLHTGRAEGSDYFRIDFDVTIRLGTEPEIIDETLTGWSGDPQEAVRHPLLRTTSPPGHAGSITASWYDRAGDLKRTHFRSSRLLIAQLPLHLQGRKYQGRLASAAQDVLSALRGVFHLDPVPHLMRQYTPGRDVRLRRTAENLSAVIGHMRENDAESFCQLVERTRALVDHDVSGIELVRSELDDVMVALREGEATTPAREMSDGLLRFIAIATTLLRQGSNLDLGRREFIGDEASPMLVIEELENGLHPAQASQLLQLVEQATHEDKTQVVFTTHSPTLLSALPAASHSDVIVSTRDRATGTSRLTRLPDVPGYPSLMAQGDLGAVVTSGLLEKATPPDNRDFTDFDRLMGIGQ